MSFEGSFNWTKRNIPWEEESHLREKSRDSTEENICPSQREPDYICKCPLGIGYILLLMRSSKPFAIMSVPLENYQLNFN